MPFMKRPLKITLPQSMATSSGKMPSRATRPPFTMFSIMPLKAVPLPLISRPTSKPSVMPISCMTAFRSSLLTSTARVAPIFRARSRR